MTMIRVGRWFRRHNQARTVTIISPKAGFRLNEGAACGDLFECGGVEFDASAVPGHGDDIVDADRANSYGDVMHTSMFAPREACEYGLGSTTV